MDTCRICFESVLHAYCDQCKLSCCQTCYNLHLKECDNLTKFKYHLCQRHGHLLDGYCCRCFQMTCDRCHPDHAGHDIISTKVAAESIGSSLADVSRDMHNKEVQLASLTDMKKIKCDTVIKIENEERKWQSLVNNIKRTLLLQIEEDFKRHDCQLQLHELLNEAKINLDALKKERFPLTILSTWACVSRAKDQFDKLIIQHLDGIVHFEKQTKSDFSQSFRSSIINFDGTSVDSTCHNKNDDIDNLTTMFARVHVSVSETSKSSDGKPKTQDCDVMEDDFVNIIHTQIPKLNNVCSHGNGETEIQRLSKHIQQLQTENERMQQTIRLQIEEKSYIDKVFSDMVKQVEQIQTRKTVGDLMISKPESATMISFMQRIELVLNRFVELNNNLITTEEQLKAKIISVANWTDEQRNEMETQMRHWENALQKKTSQIKQYEKDIQIQSCRINELQTSNEKLYQQNFNIQKEIVKLQAQSSSLKNENDILRTRIGNFQKNTEDAEDLRHSIQTLKLQSLEKERYIHALRKEKDDLQTRLSSVAGDKLTKGNPEITDLGDPNRPMKISEKYGELYDNEWTDAMEYTDDVKKNFKDLAIVDIDEIVVRHLYKLLKCCYEECLLLSQEQSHNIRTTIVDTLQLEGQDDPALSSILDCKNISILRRRNGDKFALFLFKSQVLADKIIVSLNSSWNYIYKNEELMRQLTMTSFFQKCVQLCWLMAIQDPVLYLSDDIIPDTVFDKTIYREYVQSGDKVRYVVWPALFLHKNGPLLFKGVIQAYS